LTTAAEGGLKPAPVSRFRGAYPHQSSSCALLSISPFVLVAHISRLTGQLDNWKLHSEAQSHCFLCHKSMNSLTVAGSRSGWAGSVNRDLATRLDQLSV